MRLARNATMNIELYHFTLLANLRDDHNDELIKNINNIAKNICFILENTTFKEAANTIEFKNMLSELYTNVSKLAICKLQKKINQINEKINNFDNTMSCDELYQNISSVLSFK